MSTNQEKVGTITKQFLEQAEPAMVVGEILRAYEIGCTRFNVVDKPGIVGMTVWSPASGTIQDKFLEP